MKFHVAPVVTHPMECLPLHSLGPGQRGKTAVRSRLMAAHFAPSPGSSFVPGETRSPTPFGPSVETLGYFHLSLRDKTAAFRWRQITKAEFLWALCAFLRPTVPPSEKPTVEGAGPAMHADFRGNPVASLGGASAFQSACEISVLTRKFHATVAASGRTCLEYSPSFSLSPRGRRGRRDNSETLNTHVSSERRSLSTEECGALTRRRHSLIALRERLPVAELESSANPKPGKAALRSARFPACGFWRLSFVFSTAAVFVAQTASLLYRRMPSCRTAPRLEGLISDNAQPIGNRRYSRLTICATLNRYRLSSRQILVPSRCAHLN